MNKRQRKKSEKTAQQRLRFTHLLAPFAGTIYHQDWLQGFKDLRTGLTHNFPKKGQPRADVSGSGRWTCDPNTLQWTERELRQLCKRWLKRERKKSVFRFPKVNYGKSPVLQAMAVWDEHYAATQKFLEK